MGEKFKDIYRIESTRMRNWDYGWIGKYFITICTGGQECFFGDIEDKRVKLSEIGILADRFWLEIPNHFHYVKLDQYIIMPNHVHGILEIHYRRDAINRVSTPTEIKTTFDVEDKSKIDRQRGGITGINNPMLHHNLSRVIRWYKGRVSYEIRKFQKDFYWQSRFYDSIIKDNESLNNFRTYIKNNPKNWTMDDINSENEIN